MYNRYIPQPDGSYRRSRVPDRKNQTPPPKPSQPEPAPEVCPPEVPPVPPVNPRPRRPVCKPSCPCEKRSSAGNESISGFLHKLLPKNFDTGDLLVLILLLLLAADCQEDQNTALLTLALYFFL